MTQKIMKGSEYIGSNIQMMAEKIGDKMAAVLEGSIQITRKLSYESANKGHASHHDASLFYLEFSDGETMFFYGGVAHSHGDMALVRAICDRISGFTSDASELRNKLLQDAETEHDGLVAHITFTRWRDQLFHGATYAYHV